MTDWSEVKANAINEVQQRYCFGCIKQAATVLEAVGEIEQLRQDKAELVELAESLLSAMDSLSEPQTAEDVAFQKSITEKASAILAKHGGEPND